MDQGNGPDKRFTDSFKSVWDADTIKFGCNTPFNLLFDKINLLNECDWIDDGIEPVNKLLDRFKSVRLELLVTSDIRPTRLLPTGNTMNTAEHISWHTPGKYKIRTHGNHVKYLINEG